MPPRGVHGRPAAPKITQSGSFTSAANPMARTYPSTAKQLDLLRLLVEELQEIGLPDAAIDEHGYVTATIPATVERETPTIAFFAHVDTAREVTGANVQPQRIRYEGGEIPLGDS